MSRFFKWILAGFIFLIIFVGGALLGLNHFFPRDKIKPILENEFTNFLQRKITIASLNWDIFPLPTLVCNGVQLWEDPDTVMAFAPKVQLEVAPRKLRENILEIREIRVSQSTATFRRLTGGTIPLKEMIFDIRSHLKTLAHDKAESQFKISFREFVIEDGTFYFVDQQIQEQPLSFVLLANARGEIQGQKGSRTFPFELEGKTQSPFESGPIRFNGVLSQDSEVFFKVDELPIGILQEHYPVVKNLSADLQMAGTFKKKKNELDAQIQMGNLQSRLNEKLPPLQITAALSNHQPSNIHIGINDAESNLVADLKINKWAKKDLEAKIHGTVLRMEETFNWHKAVQEILIRHPGFRRDGRWAVNAEVSLGEVRFKHEIFNDVSFSFQQTSTGSFVANNIRGNGLGGALSASVSMTGEFMPQFYDAQWNVYDVDMLRLLNLGGAHIKLSGVGSAVGQLSGDLKRMGWHGTSGEVTLEVRDGNLVDGPGFLKTFTQLNLTSLLKSIEGENKKGFSFDLARLKLYLDDGQVSLKEPGVLESKTLQVALTGVADLNKNRIDGIVVFNFLTFIDELIGVVPGIRTILVGSKKSIVPIFVEISGDLRNPDIHVKKQKTITNPVFSIFGRVLSLPKGAVDLIRGK